MLALEKGIVEGDLIHISHPGVGGELWILRGKKE